MKLTIAFITLNEEENLSGAFKNIKDIADQIVLIVLVAIRPFKL